MPRVLIGGTFDPLHAGHLAYVRAAQDVGTTYCALSDNPAKHPPLVPIEHRRCLLTHLGCIVYLEGPGLADLLDTLRPDIYLTGSDWAGRLPADEVAACEANGIEIRHVDLREASSSALLATYERARNAEKLAALEAFVQQQQPASKPWEPVTDYSREARTAAEGPHAQIIKDTFSPQRVLDAGCGADFHLVSQLGPLNLSGCAIDTNLRPGWCTKAVSEHIQFGRQLPDDEVEMFQGWYFYRTSIAADPFDFGWCLQPRAFDLVICREVLEHLTVRQLAVAVRNLVKLSSKYVYVTTRFVDSVKPIGSHLLDLVGGDSLDPTHITLLQQDFLRTLFVLEGCTRRADLETALDHRKLGRVLVYEVPA